MGATGITMTNPDLKAIQERAETCPGRPSLLWHDCCEALAEAEGKLERIETEMCVCDRTEPMAWAGCLVHDKQSPLAAILKGGSE